MNTYRKNQQIISLIGKTGTLLILESIIYIPKRYNQIKKELIDQISSRTLDHRLNDLYENKLISRKVLKNETPEGRLYSILPLGRLLHAAIYNIPDKEIPELCFMYNQSVQTYYEWGHNHEWSKVWDDLQKILSTVKSITTLSQKKENIINTFDEDEISVTTEKGSSTIKVNLIKKVWENLLIYGELSRDQHELASYRSSFIFTLLSLLDYVKITKKRPVTIKIV